MREGDAMNVLFERDEGWIQRSSFRAALLTFDLITLQWLLPSRTNLQMTVNQSAVGNRAFSNTTNIFLAITPKYRLEKAWQSATDLTFTNVGRSFSQ